jgi:hypothetical protein
VSPEFRREMDDIRLERVKKGFDKEFKSDRRLSKAIVRCSAWKQVKDIISNSPMENDKSKVGRKLKYGR